MYDVQLTLSEKYVLCEIVLSEIRIFHGLRSRLSEETWSNSDFPRVLEIYESIYSKLRDDFGEVT